MKKYFLVFLSLISIFMFSGCGYNKIQTNEEAVFKAWGDIESNLQRRADLIPNLVEVVKGYASHEKETLQAVIEASYPDYGWRTEGKIKNYWDMYTLNDNVAGYIAETLIEAYRVYGDDKYKMALRRLGDFLILAQMPEPQPAWAQQYSYEMKPI